VPNGLLGVRIGCHECDPHPLVHLFQKLMRWRSPPIDEARQLQALWYLLLWLLPPRPRMKDAIDKQKAAATGQRTARLGGAPKYEPMPPRTTLPLEAVDRARAPPPPARRPHSVASDAATASHADPTRCPRCVWMWMQVLALLADKRLLDGREHADLLAAAAASVSEQQRPPADTPLPTAPEQTSKKPDQVRKVDVDELLLYWMVT
jgi:hypothetical protein